MDKYPDLFGFSVSHCTRAPRPGEVNGVHYNFVSVPEIEKAIENNEFIEYAQVHTNYYGTSIEAVEKVYLILFLFENHFLFYFNLIYFF
jgi:guanylate kinase